MSINWRLAVSGLALAALVGICWAASYYHDKAEKLEGTVQQLQRENTQQSAVIAQQAIQFQRANEISATAHRHGINTDAATQEKEIEYRTILKNQPTCDLAVPAAVAGRLLDYTHRLRAGAVSGDTGSPDGSSSGATASSPLTYCQAVLWIDPLLSVIDKANNQLRLIRQLDDEGQVKD
ncbi:TPA: hypothetical protein PPN70_004066 [Serratia rubidaea]|nr:hypothetical protein [Serratia rubidaea]HDJ1447204.1 hypothetical protein [Serratia rubidaea]HDJ1463269.1 hypothetical protein [Serratia rubidaea]HDJ2773011.1 hypothetical protein [Serratia rubidaea]